MNDDALKCPNCRTWISEINKIQARFYYLLITYSVLTLLVGFRARALSKTIFGYDFDLKSVLQDTLVVILIIAIVVCAIVGEITEAKLKKLKKGKLF